jgi:hypothetical protein
LAVALAPRSLLPPSLLLLRLGLPALARSSRAASLTSSPLPLFFSIFPTGREEATRGGSGKCVSVLTRVSV